MPATAFSDNLKRLRTAAGWSLETTGRKLDVSFNTVARWERDINTPNLATLQRIAELFQVKVHKLLE